MQYPGHLIKRGDTGEAVGEIQKALGVQQTQVFGPTTEENVTRFQRAHDLEPDGVVGPLTWAALFAPAPTPDLGDLALHEARARVGVHEQPLGSNRGPEVDAWLRLSGLAESEIKAGRGYWCAAFVNAMVETAAKKLGVPNPIPGGAKYNCNVLFSWAKKHGRLVARPEPGDLFLCIGHGGHYHTGFVAGPVSNERFRTIEGNSNTTGDPNGTAVVSRSPGRRLSSCHYVRI